ncbi:MAG: ATP-binding protein [Treponema sp.]|nr:ATP-binding protein [Treponema sp.]MCL2273111.1 ATP-binding protein [Treponema sp.]
MKLYISRKIILISVAGVIASSLTILIITIIMMSRLLDFTIQKEMTAMHSMIIRMHQQEENRLLQHIKFLTTLPDLADAVQRSDTNAIMHNSQMSLLGRDIDSIAFTDTNGIVLFRSHSSLIGDDISRRDVIQLALKGNVSSGFFFDETALVPYTINCFSPIFKDGVLAGALSLGSNICSEEYVDNLYKLTGIHLSLYKNDITLMTSLKDRTGRRSNGVELENLQITDAVLNKGESVIIQTEIFGSPYMAMYWPIKDYNGETIGMWSTAMPMDLQTRETNRVLFIILICSLGIISIFALAASVLGRKISLPVRKITEFAVSVAKGNLDDEITVQSSDEIGQLAGALRTMVTILKDRVNEAEEQHAAAAAANKAKSNFLSTMSHEIRTPMNAIIGITEIQLRHENLAPDVLEAFEKIYSSGDMLMSIINDVLDLSKIESGKYELLEKNYEFASMISDTVQLNMMRIGSKRVEFELNVEENIPVTLLGDELRVKQILNNLLSNAFKYTETGKVTMSVVIDDSDDDKVTLKFTVSDTGQGMSKEQMEKLFDEYARFNQEANNAQEGTGLGMPITRNLINIMGGRINVESEVGKGTEFTVYLIQGKTDSAVIGSEIAENLSRFRMYNRAYLRNIKISIEPMPYGRILIVDDVETNIYVTKGLLLPYMLNEIDSANSGPEAIKKIKDGKVYDVVFMDHMMPEMDGLETVRHMREAGYKAPIIALTANAIGGQADIFIQNDFDDFILKPIDMRQLNVVMNIYVRDKQPQEVIDEVRKQTQLKQKSQQKDKPAAERDSAGSLFFNAEIPGLDIDKGLKRFDGNEQVYMDVIRSYAVSVSSLLDKIEVFNEETLDDYLIKIHGIKGTSFDVYAEPTAKEAKDLEEAGKTGNLEFIKMNHHVFIENARNLVRNIEDILSNINAKSEKLSLDRPDIKILHKLMEACNDYDMGKADDAMAELERYKYDSDNDLVIWLRDSIDRMQFEEIVEKLSE